jgi:hypothetical protein
MQKTTLLTPDHNLCLCSNMYGHIFHMWNQFIPTKLVLAGVVFASILGVHMNAKDHTLDS